VGTQVRVHSTNLELQALYLGKPFVLEEFGKLVDEHDGTSLRHPSPPTLLG
jgi:hypothetical protein